MGSKPYISRLELYLTVLTFRVLSYLKSLASLEKTLAPWCVIGACLILEYFLVKKWAFGALWSSLHRKLNLLPCFCTIISYKVYYFIYYFHRSRLVVAHSSLFLLFLGFGELQDHWIHFGRIRLVLDSLSALMNFFFSMKRIQAIWFLFLITVWVCGELTLGTSPTLSNINLRRIRYDDLGFGVKGLRP